MPFSCLFGESGNLSALVSIGHSPELPSPGGAWPNHLPATFSAPHCGWIHASIIGFTGTSRAEQGKNTFTATVYSTTTTDRWKAKLQLVLLYVQ